MSEPQKRVQQEPASETPLMKQPRISNGVAPIWLQACVKEAISKVNWRSMQSVKQELVFLSPDLNCGTKPSNVLMSDAPTKRNGLKALHDLATVNQTPSSAHKSVHLESVGMPTLVQPSKTAAVKVEPLPSPKMNVTMCCQEKKESKKIRRLKMEQLAQELKVRNEELQVKYNRKKETNGTQIKSIHKLENCLKEKDEMLKELSKEKQQLVVEAMAKNQELQTSHEEMKESCACKYKTIEKLTNQLIEKDDKLLELMQQAHDKAEEKGNLLERIKNDQYKIDEMQLKISTLEAKCKKQESDLTEKQLEHDLLVNDYNHRTNNQLLEMEKQKDSLCKENESYRAKLFEIYDKLINLQEEHQKLLHKTCVKSNTEGGSSVYLTPIVEINEQLKTTHDEPQQDDVANDHKEDSLMVVNQAPGTSREVPLSVDEHKVHICQICDKIFPNSFLLTFHIDIHRLYPHLCEICKMTFSSKRELDIHVVKHQGGTVYNCKICWKSFKANSLFQNHLKRHLNESSLVCHVCAKSFRDKYTLKTHLKIHEKDLISSITNGFK